MEYAQLVSQVTLDPTGATLAALAAAANRLGFSTNAIRIGPNQLATVSYPAIAHLAEDHYVVVFDGTSEQMTIGDPAAGLRQISVSEFASAWTGALLLVRCKTLLDA